MRSLLVPRGGDGRCPSWRAHGSRHGIAVASAVLTATLAVLGHRALQADIPILALALILAIAAVTAGAWYQANRLAHADLERSLVAMERQVEDRTRALSDADRALQTQIDARERLEGELRHAQKLEAIAHLAGGVVHDFNNILMVVQGYSDMVLAEVPPGSSIRGDVREIQQAARRGSDLTKQLLAFGRKQVLHVRPLDLNAVLVDTSHMLARLIGESVTLDLQPALAVCPIEADRVQLEQVLMNLAVNARDAMSRRGTLSIAIDRVQREHETSDLPRGAYAQLVVRDTGCGMDEATRARVFEPFFTTKPAGAGSGLGLSTVFGVVRQLGGAIVVDSTPLVGTTFTIYFPLTTKPIATSREVVVPDSISPRTETVLVVEDDRAVRTVIDHLLRRHGYEVLLAETPREALASARAYKGRIDLVLSDVIMPGMSGPEMVALLAVPHPESQTVYVTGYPAEVLIRERVLSAQARVVQKPVPSRELLRAVRDALGPQEASPSGSPIRIAS